MKKYIAFLIPFLAIFLSACNFSLAADVTPPPGAQHPGSSTTAPSQQISGPLYPIVAPDPKAGKAIYTEKCAPCHGQTGLGDGDRAAGLPNPVAPIGATDLARAATPAQWYMVVTQGNLERFMPPFPSLNDRQRWDVISYAFTRSEPAGSVEQGKQLYLANCASCHGESGKGDGPQAAGKAMPNLSDQEFMAGQSATSLFQSITNHSSTDMPAFSDRLSEAERWSLTDYLRSLTFSATGELAAVTPAPGQALPTPGVEVTAPVTTTLATGIISGTVTNASGGQLPLGEEVMLHGFDNMQVALTQTTTVSPDGTYQFNNIAFSDQRMFFASLQHQGVTYGSDVATVDAGQTSFDLPITVYDTTSEPSALTIERLHVFFEQADAQTMRVAELVIMSNSGDKTIVPPAPGKPIVDFLLPAGYKNLQFQDGELGGRYIQTANGFGDTANIYPGQGSYQVLLAYDMPYSGKLQLLQTLPLAADAVVILVPQQNFKVKGANLQGSGTRDVQGIQYQMYNMSGLQAGQQLNLTVSNSFSMGSSTKTGLVIGLAALGLALILGGVWVYWRSKSRNEKPEQESEAPAAPGAFAETADDLMDAILALDDLHRAGQISDEVYLNRRDELKARLKQVIGE